MGADTAKATAPRSNPLALAASIWRVDTMKYGITYLGIALFMAGSAFQEAIMGAGLNYPDGGWGSAVVALWLLAAGFGVMSRS